MAEPLDLEALGVPGKRNEPRVAETVDLVKPFTEGRTDLGVGPSGAVFPLAKTETKTQNADGKQTESDAAADAHFRSRIGRRFRSF